MSRLSLRHLHPPQSRRGFWHEIGTIFYLLNAESGKQEMKYNWIANSLEWETSSSPPPSHLCFSHQSIEWHATRCDDELVVGPNHWRKGDSGIWSVLNSNNILGRWFLFYCADEELLITRRVGNLDNGKNQQHKKKLGSNKDRYKRTPNRPLTSALDLGQSDWPAMTSNLPSAFSRY